MYETREIHVLHQVSWIVKLASELTSLVVLHLTNSETVNFFRMSSLFRNKSLNNGADYYIFMEFIGNIVRFAGLWFTVILSNNVTIEKAFPINQNIENSYFYITQSDSSLNIASIVQLPKHRWLVIEISKLYNVNESIWKLLPTTAWLDKKLEFLL